MGNLLILGPSVFSPLFKAKTLDYLFDNQAVADVTISKHSMEQLLFAYRPILSNN
jgi:hypothetical protein